VPEAELTPESRVERDWLRTDPHGDVLVQAYPMLRDLLTPRLPEPIARGRAEAVIAEGEEGYMGTVAPTEADIRARREAAAELPAPVSESAPAVTAPETAPSIHEVARNINPALVDEWQALDARKQDYRRWLDELAEKRDA